MLRHLRERYGEIEEHFFVNYEHDSILAKVGMGLRVNDTEMLALKGSIEQELEDVIGIIEKSGRSQEITTDENVLEIENFESLMVKMDKKDLNEAANQSDDEVGRPFTQEELLSQKRQSKLQAENKELERSHLAKAVTRKGFIRFQDYSSKLRMMDTAMFLFGLKLHRQDDHVKFYDADFLNTIQVSSPLFYE